MTVRDAILEAIKALVANIPNAVVYRSREAALSREEGVGILIRPEEEDATQLGREATKRDFKIVVTVIARGDIPDQIADPIVEQVHAALMADDTFGKIVAQVIEHSTKWDFEVADQNAVAVEMRYTVRLMTPANSLSRVI